MNPIRNTAAIAITGAVVAFSLIGPTAHPAIVTLAPSVSNTAPAPAVAPTSTAVESTNDRRLVRHPAVLSNPIQHAKHLFANDPGHGDPTLSEAERSAALVILESAVDLASRDLEEAHAQHQASGTPDDELTVLEKQLVLTSMLARLEAFDAGNYVVRDLHKAEAWTGPVCLQVRNYFLRPTGHRQIVVLVDTSPTTAVGRATSLFQEARASKNP